MPLSPADETWLSTRGIAPEEARRQTRLLSQGALAPALERPATVGDGIARLTPEQRDHWVSKALASHPETGFFVPASGAASRMFAGLKESARTQESLASDPQITRLLDCDAVKASLPAGLDAPTAVSRLLNAPAQGLGWPQLPKAFLPFHLDAAGKALTAIEAQMQECCALIGPGGKATLHCSLSPEHRTRETELAATAAATAAKAACSLDFFATEQDSATDTLSLRGNGDLARTDDGRPQLRAGGHGSLLANLAKTPGKVVLIKNIDNIQPLSRQDKIVPWRLALSGIALELRRLGDALLATLPGTPEEIEAAAAFAALLAELGRPEEADPAGLRMLADRPLRAVAMVPNDGAAGGGPFWVVGKGLQIVEQSEVSKDPAQQAILAAATHFNPVDMACCLDRPDGSRHDLEAFRDPNRAFLSSKPDPQGGNLTVLEHPGLWNGSMGDWLTIFVETPPETFLPAKTVFDLAHPWRQLA